MFHKLTMAKLNKKGSMSRNKVTKSVKITNKQRKGKRTKPRERKHVTFKTKPDIKTGHRNSVNNVESVHSSDDDALDMIEKDDLDYLKSSYNNISFLQNAQNNAEVQHKCALAEESEGSALDDEEEDYEKGVRNNFAPVKRMRSLLPIKGKEGLIPVSVEVFEESEEEEELEVLKAGPATSKQQEPMTLVEMCAKRDKLLASRKQRVGVIAMSVIENPEENLKKLKELIMMLDESDPLMFLSMQKIVSLSLTEIFKDIIPSYSIRLPTEKEKMQRVKKDIKALRTYEESLLHLYKKFLQKLEFLTSGLKNKGMQRSIDFNISKKAQIYLGTTAIKCFCDLLMSHPHFNFRNNIIRVLSSFMAHKEESVSNMCCNAFKTLYSEDKLGEASLEAVKLTSKLVKHRNMQVPAKVLDTFLSLRISEASIKNEEKQKIASKEIKRKLKMMSRKEKKHRKRMQKLEKELEETEGEESKERKSRFHTEILNHVFVTYFRILKSQETNPSLLSTVLAGLSKFAHLINIDFFDDLIAIICKLLDSVDLDKLQTFHCLHTVFTILSGEGQALNIDPQRFYVHLYKNMLHTGLVKDDSVTEALLKCVDMMVLKRRKKLTVQRMLAVIKRLCTASLLQSHNGALSFLACVKLIMQNSRACDVILDTEEGHGSGTFLPELDDPEYCNASATILWELLRLRRHYHPHVQKYAQHVSLGCPLQGEGQIPTEMAKNSPSEIYASFSPNNMEFNPPLLSLEELGLKVGKKRKIHPCFFSSTSILHDAKKLYSKEDDVDSVNFCKCIMNGFINYST